MRVLYFLLILGSCTKQLPPEKQALYDQGKKLYTTHCIACHNPNPSRPGPSGPPLKNASMELIHNKVLLGTYPNGYKPKMPSKLMRIFKEQLNKSDIEALAIFLQN